MTSPLEHSTDRVANVMFRLRNRHFLLIDLVIFAITPLLAFGLRVDPYDQLLGYLEPLAFYALCAIIIRCSIFAAFGIYSRYWRYASVDELWQITQAMIASTLVIMLVFFGILRPLGLIPDDFPRSLPLIDAVLVFLAVGGTRYSIRLMERSVQRQRTNKMPRIKVAVFGAGEAGVMIVREMQANPQLGLQPVVFLDDDPRKHHSLIHGVPVIGDRRLLESLRSDYHVQEAIIAMPNASGKMIRDITAACARANIPVKTVPGMFELLDGSVTVNKLRDVEIDDLLRREPIVTDITAVTELVRGKTVLVTGAGGSIGGELCRQIARCAPAHLILLGHGENSLFLQGNELAPAFPGLKFDLIVADVRDAPRINSILARFQPQLIFHAAAHKHVPLMETNVEDAVTNNVLGTRTMLDAATAHNVAQFVLISSDKAVNPVNVMGATKRVAELLVHARALETDRHYAAVRFGNVLGSRGSVVPLFKRQIAQGGPVTVTDPEVRRFFMTIPEAVQLVLQAATLGKGGEIFALDMGEPIKIVDLAYDLIRLSGLQVGRDIDVEFTGLRPGDKLYEELFVPGELYQRTQHQKIYVARNGARPPSDAHARLYAAVNDLVCAAQQGDPDATRTRLSRIVPEFQTLETPA